MARRFSSMLAALTLAGLPATAIAQAPAAPIAPAAPAAPGAQVPPPSKEVLEQAAYEMHVMISAMQSDKVEGPVKDVLFNCLYNNNFAKISDTMAKVIADNTGKVDKRNADQMLFIMARVCGYNPPATAAGAAGAKPGTPAPAAAKPATPAPTKPAAPAAKKPATSGR